MLIISEKTWQLGNRLQLAAHMIATAEDMRTSLCNLAFEDYAEHFEHTATDLLCRYPPRRSFLRPKPRLRRVILSLAQRIVRRYQSLPAFAKKLIPIHVFTTEFRKDRCIRCELAEAGGASRGFLFIHGYYFKDPEAVRRHADRIRSYWQPRADHRSVIDSVVSAARDGATILIGVHIRHGDYKQYRGGEYFFTVEQYAVVMRSVRELWPDQRVRFLICSDAPQDPTCFAPLDVRLGPGQLVQDMYSLSKCDFVIGPTSTFSAWASFHGRVPRYVIVDPSRPVAAEDFTVCEIPM